MRTRCPENLTHVALKGHCDFALYTPVSSHGKVEPRGPESGTLTSIAPSKFSKKDFTSTRLEAPVPTSHCICSSPEKATGQVEGNSDVRSKFTGCKLKEGYNQDSPGSQNRQLFWATNYSF